MQRDVSQSVCKIVGKRIIHRATSNTTTHRAVRANKLTQDIRDQERRDRKPNEEGQGQCNGGTLAHAAHGTSPDAVLSDIGLICHFNEIT